MVQVEIHVQHGADAVDRRQLKLAIQEVLRQEGIMNAEISLAVVDDLTIQRLNRRYLQHDYPTDVLSFVLDRSSQGHLEGEIIVSLEMAAQQSREFDWPVENELLLYVIHGTLHLVGYDDQQESPRVEMRKKEHHYLAQLARLPIGPTSLGDMRCSRGLPRESDKP